MREKIKNNLPWVAGIVVLLCLFYLYGWWQNTKLADLKAMYNANLLELAKAEQLTQEYLQQIEIQKTTIATLQTINDSKIKEAVKNAYKKGSSITDAELLDAWNDVINSARKRNADRRNDFPVNE